MSKDPILDERMVVAVEKIAQAFSRIANSLEEKNDFNSDWGERLEYYLHLIKAQYLKEPDEETGDNSSIQE